MHYARLIVLFLLILCLAAGRLAAHAALLSPEGGETFTAGQIIQIEWVVVIEHETENWDLYFSADGGDTWDPLILNLPVSQLSYQWSVPYTETIDGRVRVVQDNVGMDYFDASDVFTIVVLPFNGPEIVNGAQDLTLDCDTQDPEVQIEAWLDDNGGAMATGNCGDIIWSNDYSGLTNGCGSTGSAVVTFSVSDDCGGTLTTATVSIQDIDGPVIEGPATDMIVECDGKGNMAEFNNWLTSSGAASAFDACGEITWANDFNAMTPGCGSTGEALVTFIAYDDCGNMSTTSAQFSIIDSTSPMIMTSARDTILNCSGSTPGPMIQAWLEAHGNAIAGDECSGVSWSNDFIDFPDHCINAYSRTVHFTVTDGCANTAMTQATLILEGAVGVESPDQQPGFRMYPNPARHHLEIISELEGQGFSISVYNFTGALILRQASQAKMTAIDLQGIVPGTYVVQLLSDEWVFTRSLVIE